MSSQSVTSTQKSYSRDQMDEAKKHRLAIAAEKTRLARASSQMSSAAPLSSSNPVTPVGSTTPVRPAGNSQISLSQEQYDTIKKKRLACLARNAAKVRTVPIAGQKAVRVPRLMPIPRPLMPQSKAWVEKSGDEIMKSVGPMKSSHEYDLAWAKFEEFRNSSDEPGEQDYLKYFHYLHDGREFKASTLWKTYGMLNSLHQRKYGERLQIWPRLKMLLKRYNQG